jgi:hypothetical protein
LNDFETYLTPMLPRVAVGVAAPRPFSFLADGVDPFKVSLDGQPFLSFFLLLSFLLSFLSFLLILLALDESFLFAAITVLLVFVGRCGELSNMRAIGVKGLLFCSFLLIFLMKGKRVLELLCKILVDAFAALEDGSSIFEAFDLFHDEADGIDLVLLAAVYGDYAFSVFLLLVRKDFYHGAARAFDDVSNHVAF